LRPDEVREVQTRLLGSGFNPGPIDGAAGRMTTAAAMRYQQERSLEQTGKVDRSLLEQLRQDSSSQVAQQTTPPAAPRANPRAGRPDGRTSRTTAQRDPGPFDRMGRWLDSLTR
jgi:peptidoglycan hydrolase-like protein with peptidoglycan-binding domain